MRPLQDRCDPTDYEALEPMVLHDTGHTIEELYSEFDREPIGVASLAQVHRARLRENGELVAVKVRCAQRLWPHRLTRECSCSILTWTNSVRLT